MKTLSARLATLALALVAAPVFGQQQQARGTLYAREEAGTVRAALEIAISPGWHLYHGPTKADLGPPEAIGKPTQVLLQGAPVEWGAAVFPTPERAVQDFGGDPTWIHQHEGTIVVRVDGKATAGVDLAGLVAKVDGLTCSDADGRCIPYTEELRVAGKGADALFAATGASASGAAPVLASSAHVASAAQDLGRALAGDFGLESARVRATLWVRPSSGEVHAAIRVVIAPGWHLYHGPTKADMGAKAIGKPTTVALSAEGFDGAIDWEPLVYPTPQRAQQDIGLGSPVEVNQHEGTIVLHAIGRPRSGTAEDAAAHVTAVFDGEVCSDEAGTCVPVHEALKSAGTGSDEVFAGLAAARSAGAATNAAGGSDDGVPDAGTLAPPSTSGGDAGLALFLLAAVGWGLFTLLMPCTYPMIPITISFFTKQASARHKSVLPLALAYGLGIVAIFVLIGVAVGPVIIQFATHPVTNLVIGLLFVFFALALFGAFELQPPAFLMSAAGKASSHGGYVGVFLMGATLVVTSFTCTAPFVGSLLSLGATQGGVLRIALGMAVFGATMAIPFVLLSLLPGKVKAMPRSGEWMHVLKVFLGFVEVAAALKFLSNSDLIWQWGWLSRELFLVLWLAIFLVAALFLLGLIRLAGESSEGIGPKRFVAGLATLLFAGYCGYGALGHRMDRIMTAIIPPYSNLEAGTMQGRAGTREATHTIVVDDYEAARRLALEQGKGLLVNFTGHTCVNCRMMELGVFPRPEVAVELENYVEARLHTDGTTNIDEIRRLQREMTQSVANPFYVIVNPSTEEVLDRHEGATLGSPQVFIEFLRRNVARARDFQTAKAKR